MACLTGCSGHGSCGVGGSCVCSPGWEGWACSYNLHQAVSATEEGVQQATRGLQTLTKLATAQETLRKLATAQAAYSQSAPRNGFLGSLVRSPSTNYGVAVPDHNAALFAGGRVQDLGGQVTQRSVANGIVGASASALVQARGAAAAAQAAAEQLLRVAKEANEKDAQVRIQRAIQEARGHAKELAGGEFAADEPGASLLTGASSGVMNASDNACGQGCNGHGTCDPSHGGCQCSEGWHGALCDMVACPNDCSNNGVCIGGMCMCKKTHFGAGCQNLRCLHDCSNRGYCFEGKCQCEDGYGGDACTELLQSAGVVHLEVPAQRAGVTGKATLDVSTIRSTQQANCPAGCMGHGTCLKSGRCLCAEGWTGTACADFCPEDCSGHGSCTGGACLCSDGYQGTDCALQAAVSLKVTPSRTCPMACSGHGTCTEPGVCMCTVGWLGSDCSRQNATFPEQRQASSALGKEVSLASTQEAAEEEEEEAGQPQHFSGHLRDDAAPQTAPWIPVTSEVKKDAVAPKDPSSQLSSDRSKGKRLALLGVATEPHTGRGALASLLKSAARQGRKQAIPAPVPATKPGPNPMEQVTQQ